MKKIISLLLLTAVVGMAAAQNIAYQQGEKTNKKAYQSSMIKLLPGNKQGEIVSVEPELKAVTTMGDPNHSIKSVLVRLVDAEWNETQSVKIANTAEWGISDAFRTESKIHLLLDNVEKQNYTIRHVALDAATLQVSVDEHLMKTTLEKGSEGYFLTATSPDGQYHGVVFSALGKKNVVIETRMILFDKEMNKVWEQKVDNNIAHKMLVSNQGDIVIYSMSFTDKSKDETVVRFNAANAQGVKYGEFVTADDIDQLALLQYKGGNLVATALEGQGGRSLIQFSLPGHVAGRHYLAVHSYLFDMNVGRLTADNRHEFTDDEACVFFNTKVPPIVKPDFLTQVDQVTTDDGGYVLYHRIWKVETRNTKTGMTVSETVYSRGLLLVHVDNAGNLLWTRGIMQNNQNANWPNVEADLFEYNGNLYVVTNEAKDAPEEYSAKEPALNSGKLILANTALAIYKFTPQGMGSKQMLARDGKHLLFSPLFHSGDGRFYLLSGALAPKISTVVIP